SGETLRDAWSNGIAAHRTIAAPGFPNFFLLLGPNSGLGHNSVILMIEAQVNYVIDLIKMAGEEALIKPRQDAAQNYDKAIQHDLHERVWAAQCGAWYVDEKGRNYTLYPHSVRRFLKDMKHPDFSEYEIRREERTQPVSASVS
ncbi:MAG: hypothetical protein AAFW68_09710, partial [Pseudomonadota bacterium]